MPVIGRRELGLFVAVVLLWGVNWPMMKMALAELNFERVRTMDLRAEGALTPAVVTELGAFDAAKRSKLVERTLQNIDGTCAALDLGSRQELRKLLDLLAIGPLRYSLTGVGAWNEAGIDKMQVFLARWRGSRFATLNAGGNVLVKLTSSSFYVLPESWPSTGYPGPLEYVFNAINS